MVRGDDDGDRLVRSDTTSRMLRQFQQMERQGGERKGDRRLEGGRNVNEGLGGVGEELGEAGRRLQEKRRVSDAGMTAWLRDGRSQEAYDDGNGKPAIKLHV